MTRRQGERTNVVVAIVGLALVLVVSPLSPLLTAAVVVTMVGVALTYVLTSNPVRIVRRPRRDARPAPRPGESRPT